MNLPPIFAVLETLPRFKQTRETQWTACCPAHEDTVSSLSIGIGSDGRILLKCFTGCDREDIRAALNAPWSDYFPGGSFPGEKRYEVRDRNGVVRGVQKRVYDKNGKKYCPWLETGTKAQDMPLYGSEQVKELAAGATVIVCEGPYAADVLRRHGVAAFATVTGAGGQPNDDALRVLRKFTVILWPDADEPGEKHMRKIAARLLEMNVTIAGVIREEHPGLHDDADNYFAHGGTVEELGKLVVGLDSRPLPEHQDNADLLTLDIAPPKWAVPHLFAEGLNVLAGKPKKGKSTMMLQICNAIVTGGLALGKIECAQGETLYLALEDNPRRMQRRLNTILPRNAVGDAILPYGTRTAYKWPRLDDGGIEALSDWMRKYPQTRLIVVDTFARVKPRMQNKNTPLYEQDYTSLETLQSWAITQGVAVVAIVHLRKMGAEDVLDEISGSTGLTAVADNLVVMRQSNGVTTLYRKGRDYDEETPWALVGDEETLLWRLQNNVYDATRSAERTTLLEALSMMGGWRSPKAIAEFTGKARIAIRVALRRIVDSGDTALEYDSERHLYRVADRATKLPSMPVFTSTYIAVEDDSVDKEGIESSNTDTHGLDSRLDGVTGNVTSMKQSNRKEEGGDVSQSYIPVTGGSNRVESSNNQGLGASVTGIHSMGEKRIAPLPKGTEQCPRREPGNPHNFVTSKKPPYVRRCEFCRKEVPLTRD